MFEDILGLRPAKFDHLRARAESTRGIARMKGEVDWAIIGGLDAILRAIDILISRYNRVRGIGADAVERLARHGVDVRDVPDDVFDDVIADEKSPLALAVGSAHEGLNAIEEELKRLVEGAAKHGARVVIEKRSV